MPVVIPETEYFSFDNRLTGFDRFDELKDLAFWLASKGITVTVDQGGISWKSEFGIGSAVAHNYPSDCLYSINAGGGLHGERF